MKINNVTAVFVTVNGLKGYLGPDGWILPDQPLADTLNAAYNMPAFNARPDTVSREYDDLYALALWAQREFEPRIEITDFIAETEDLPRGAVL